MKSVFPKRTRYNRAPGQHGSQPAHNRFDFRQLRHGNGVARKLRKRQAGRGHDAGHAQNLLILLLGYRRNNQPHVLQEFHFA